MPGVPSSRGCDACRKQKKKCDQTEPACSRCSRLGIPCAGGGRQRFKFINASSSSGSPEESESSTAVVRSKPSASARSAKAREIFFMPRNQETYLQKRLVSWLDISDARYDSTVFGGFLTMIPMRIGLSPALDRSLEAFYNAYVEDKCIAASVVSVRKHGYALRALRDSLLAGPQSAKPETMIAVYLTMLTESQISGTNRERHANHVAVLAKMLECYADKEWPTEFEVNVIATMYITVLIGATGDPRVTLDPWADMLLDRLEPQVAGAMLPEAIAAHQMRQQRWPSLELRHLTHMVKLTRDPVGRLDEFQAAYDLLRIDLGVLRSIMCPLPGYLGGAIPLDRIPSKRIRNGLSSQFSMGLIWGMAFNRMLQEYRPEDTTLNIELNEHIDNMAFLTVRAMPDRPLGATYCPPGMVVAFSASRDPVRRENMKRLMSEFSVEFADINWQDGIKFWDKKLEHVKLAVRKSRNEDIEKELQELELKLWDDPCHMQ